MPSLARRQWLAQKPRALYDLVADVPAYTRHLRGCTAARIRAAGDGWQEAELQLGMGGWNITLCTRNNLEPPQRIAMELVEGPFHHFDGIWQFLPDNGGCLASLDLSFRAHNPLLNMAAGRLLSAAADDLLHSLGRAA